jgi:hypothetical protein
MPSKREISVAIERGVQFLESAQLESGAFRATVAYSPDMTARPQQHLAAFMAYMMAYMLLSCPAARQVLDPLVAFIARERRRGDLFHYWPKGHEVNVVPVDIDDTALASIVLAACGHDIDNRDILLANRDPHGMFYTWLTPKRRPVNWQHLRRDWRQAFKRWEKSPVFSREKQRSHDVDGGINANALAWLGEFEGDEKVVGRLLQILREGREAHCDRYYDEPFAILYFFSKALAGRCPEAGGIILSRPCPAADASAMRIAFAMLVRSAWKAEPDADLVARLLAAQSGDGSWPMASLFINSRPRLGYMHFGETPHNAWRAGSEELTTAIAVGALHSLSGPAQ